MHCESEKTRGSEQPNGKLDTSEAAKTTRPIPTENLGNYNNLQQLAKSCVSLTKSNEVSMPPELPLNLKHESLIRLGWQMFITK